MFRPRHAYRSPITNRYRGKAKGCPVFNNLTDINSEMVEQHDDCLECLAKVKNRTDLYRTLADSNKPSNNVIKSLQKLSSSASNNRLKTCLQFLIIKVNEKSSLTSQQQQTNGTHKNVSLKSSNEIVKDTDQLTTTMTPDQTVITSRYDRRQRLHDQQQKQRQQQQHFIKQIKQKQQQNPLASPPQDQVSSTQDQIVGQTQNDHDCQTSPMMSTQVDSDKNHHQLIQDSPPSTTHATTSTTTMSVKHDEDDDEQLINSNAQTQSSPSPNCASTTMKSTTTLITTSPTQTESMDGGMNASTTTTATTTLMNSIKRNLNDSQATIKSRHTTSSTSKRRKIHNSSDHDTSSTASWSSSYASPPSPISTSSASSITSRVSTEASSMCHNRIDNHVLVDDNSESDSDSSCSSSSSSLSPTPSPSPLSSPDIVNELRGPRLKLSEEKIRKIKRRPILFDDLYYSVFNEHSFASTPTTSSGCSPGQHSNTTQNSDQSRSCSSGVSSGLSIITSNLQQPPAVHMFQAPPRFVNNLKPCNLPTNPQEPSPTSSNQSPNAQNLKMKDVRLNCAICGIKACPPNISKVFGSNSCLLCAEFFTTFLKHPQQLYCAQDGDCLMTFDSRCQACWIKICLQKFDIEEKHRKIGQKYSPKLLSSPNVSLITIDTSLSR